MTVLLARSAYFAACDGTGAIAECDGLDSVQWSWLCQLHGRGRDRPWG